MRARRFRAEAANLKGPLLEKAKALAATPEGAKEREIYFFCTHCPDSCRNQVPAGA
jgi:hypothetical protein